MLKYITTDAAEARSVYGADIGEWIDDWSGVLLRKENGHVEVIHIDGCMEPEDARLGRSLDSFVSELNRCANRINELEP